MIRHYLKQALRSFWANKLIFGGSIITVILGTLSISLLFTYVYNELSMDNFHRLKNDIYLSVYQASPESQKEYVNARSYFRFNSKEYSEIEYSFMLNKFQKNDINFVYDNSVFTAEGITADSCFFQVFDFKLKVGDPKKILSDPYGAVLSERFAKKMFGDENPIGKVIKTSGQITKVYTIKGIVENPPSNSSINFDYVLPRYSAGINIVGIYFLLTKSGINKTAFIKKIENAPFPEGTNYKEGKMSLVSLNDVYFSGIPLGFGNIFSRSGDKESLFILYFTIAILLFISILNFSNLQIISINASVKNIGINKITGARSYHIFFQKATEILLLITISSLLLTLSYDLVLPYFNGIAGVALNPHIFLVLMLNGAILIILTGLAMIYPAFVFSRIPITLSLKNQLFTANMIFGRQSIVVVQFALSMFLLIASTVIVKQLNYMLNKDIGFTNRNIVKLQLVHDIPFSGSYDQKQLDEQQKIYMFVKNELNSNPLILNFTQGSSPLESFQMPWALVNGKNEFNTLNTLSVDYTSYAELFGLKLLKGRFFDAQKDSRKFDQIVINEAAMKALGIEDILGARLINKHLRTDFGFEVIGVVKDFNYERLNYGTRPLVMIAADRIARNFFIQFKEGENQSGLQFIRKLYEKINPDEIFQYSFLSDEVAALYKKEKQLSQIYIIFTLIAFLISVTGLFTIAIYDTNKRTKEIGIRKVSGATVKDVITMLNKDFLRWVTFALIIATPISWYVMHKWLENFAYKTDLSWWIFALAALLALTIALITVSWQSWKAATRNPVEALRYE